VLRVERPRRLLVGEDNDTDLILLCRLNATESIEASWLLVMTEMRYAAREFAGQATNGGLQETALSGQVGSQRRTGALRQPQTSGRVLDHGIQATVSPIRSNTTPEVAV